MSEWITDRRPTAEDAEGGYVWVTTEHCNVLRQLWNQIGDRPWMPLTPPLPYVKPKRFRVAVASGMIVVCDYTNGEEVAGFIPTYEAAERIAAIYEEVMP